MSDPDQRPDDRAVLNGVIAMVAVTLGVGLVLALVALAATRVLGIGGSDGSTASGRNVQESAVIPMPSETAEETGPRITLYTEEPDETASSDTDEDESDDASDGASSEATEPTDSESATGEISLQAASNTVGAGERIYFSGVYPGGEGEILFMQRWQDGGWVDFPASFGVSNGTFSSYVFTGQTGLNRFRVINRDTGAVSNEMRVTVG